MFYSVAFCEKNLALQISGGFTPKGQHFLIYKRPPAGITFWYQIRLKFGILCDFSCALGWFLFLVGVWFVVVLMAIFFTDTLLYFCAY